MRTKLAAELALLGRELGEVEERERRKREAAAAESKRLEPYREFYTKRIVEGWPSDRREAWVRELASKLGYEVSELERLLGQPA